MRRLLAVKPDNLNYVDYYTVSAAYSYREARAMIEEAEKRRMPFDDLDLCVRNEKEFWDFVDWMEKRRTKYPFSIFGYKDAEHFMKIRDTVKARGFHFNS